MDADKPTYIEDASLSHHTQDSISISSERSGVQPNAPLKRQLKSRHIIMISVGGVIGQGLFLSSGGALAAAGPAGLLIAYSIVGFIVFWVTFALGEMAAYMPISGSFTIYCRRFVDNSFGAMVGYNYVATWCLITAAEFVAIPLVLDYWTTAVPSWAWSLICLVIVFSINLYGIRGFGEVEYVLSLIKILAVIVYIIVGIFISAGVIGGQKYGFTYWNDPGAFTPNKAHILNAIVLASLTMQGTEIVGVTAAEADNPAKNIPKAIRNVFWRIVVFYLGSVFIAGMILPYDDPNLLTQGAKSVSISPFTLVFKKGGLDALAHVINGVILCTILSCANSGLYVSSRTLHALALEGLTHKRLAYVNNRGVPIYALCASAAVSLVSFLTTFIPGNALFLCLSTISGVAGFITWGSISLARYRMRKAFIVQGRSLSDLPYVAPGFPYFDIFSIFACGVLALLGGWSSFSPPDPIGLVGNYAGLVIAFFGFVITKWWTKSKVVRLCDIDLDTGRTQHVAQEIEEEKETWWRKILSYIF
ncbi:hypothetical protein K450DRAFT_282982 [Umbelopsis ramanniana AG]|uniref:Amino acid permease/ SLC12A domain-containing protein n=1 Tax=Umbelopsis ramanniana AG TaxID=1314678 RepID=A0AAD5E3U5_UMBRA|nr:uncharacterized protein K450DRAFT_282982 [Umbelopsis ramanniana AG]KAI8577048.1 hypothetical protein K450DRAFT_282982 [Umbelopsis ramanniana AG]